MPQFFALRSSDLARTIAEIDLKTARGMVARGEAEWTGNSKSLRLFANKLSLNQCKFPAAALRAYRASLVEQIRQREASGESMTPRIEAIMRFNMQLDRLRIAHGNLADCDCWHTKEELVRHEALERKGAELVARTRKLQEVA